MEKLDWPALQLIGFWSRRAPSLAADPLSSITSTANLANERKNKIQYIFWWTTFNEKKKSVMGPVGVLWQSRAAQPEDLEAVGQWHGP